MLQRAQLHDCIAAAPCPSLAALAPANTVAAAAALTFAPAPAAAVAAPDLLQDLCRDCDIKLLVFRTHR